MLFSIKLSKHRCDHFIENYISIGNEIKFEDTDDGVNLN